jgi:hypothetical protein
MTNRKGHGAITPMESNYLNRAARAPEAQTPRKIT